MNSKNAKDPNTMDEQLFPPAQPAPLAPPPGLQLPSATAQITSIATRLKLAEERYANLSKRNQITEASLLSFEKDIKAELRVLTKQTIELRKHLADINAKIDAITGELGTVVHKYEFLTVERYLDLWQPMMFITREEARRLIAAAVQEQKQQQEKQDSTAGLGERNA